MRICQINGGVFGSTGRIIFNVSEKARQNKMEAICLSPVTSTNRFKEPGHKYIKIGNYKARQLSVLLARITGFNGCFSHFATVMALKKIKEFNPDIIHLHNMHDSYINLPMLFRFIKKHNIKTVWTLHDCWAFTGHCTHFVMYNCDKWQSECKNCSHKNVYPISLFDNSKKMHRLKKKWIKGIKSLTIVTPSKWLAQMAKQSFLKEYPIQVINNGIDLNIFKPTPSDFRKKHGLENKKIVLGVAFGWGEKKGLDVFERLAETLDEDIKIVLVGTDSNIDAQLPKNILSIHRTQSQTELAEIYTAADLFVNCTREDTFPTVNIEALACGTPVITFKTGGSPEILDENCGIVVDLDDVDGIEMQIRYVLEQRPFSKEDCLNRAKQFDMNDKFMEYIELYKKLNN